MGKIVEEAGRLAVCARLAILRLDQEPVLLLLVAMHADEIPIAFQAVAMQSKREVAFFQPRARIALRFPGTLIPEHDGAAAILALRYRALKTAVGKRMILGPDSQAFVGGIETGSLRDGPAQEDAIQFEPEVIMQAGRIMLLDQIRQLFLPRRSPPGNPAWRRLGRLAEIPLALVFFESHLIRRCSRR